MTLSHYTECLDCGFVLEAEGATEPTPKRWDSCPDCDGTDFGFSDD